MKTTEEWDEEYERNIHVDLPGKRRVGEPYREHIRQLETENDRLRKEKRELYEAYIKMHRQRDRLRQALETLIVGACAVAVPHDEERKVLQEAVDIAGAALEEGGQDET